MEAVLDALTVDEASDGDTMDLSALRFLRPVHLVAVAARAHAATQVGRLFHLVGPEARDPAVYASRMRLGSAIAHLGQTHTLPSDVTEHDHSRSLLEVSEIASRHEVRRLAELVHDKVDRTDPEMAAALFESIGEIGLNVQDHAGAGAVGFVAAQTMPALGELRFAIGDAGRGFLETLRPRGARTSRSAIELALDGVSRFDDPDRGTGVLETARLVAELGGEILVVSGDGEVSQSATSRVGREARTRFAGTVVEAVIPLSRGRHAAQLP